MHNCLTIPFDSLLENGFNTRQTDVRPAKSVSTAFQLCAVIFQIQSLQQFGGVSASHIDWTMVPYVKGSFRKHIRDWYDDVEDLGKEKAEETVKELEKVFGELNFSNENFKNEYGKVYKYAVKQTRKETHQAIEAMYHNLNTLQSRSGNQLPFSSLNYGTCTLPEGRLVTEELLNVCIEGLGKYGRTSIFPCGIFQCKEGISKRPGDPNYDLFRLALKSTSQRLYPNYANCDWSNQKSWKAFDIKVKEKVVNELTDAERAKLIDRLEECPNLAEKVSIKIGHGSISIDVEEKPYEYFSTMGK